MTRLHIQIASMGAWLKGDESGYVRGLEAARKLCDYAGSVKALSEVLEGLIEKMRAHPADLIAGGEEGEDA